MLKNRLIEKKLKKHFEKYKQALVLLGGRQVGKTTLLKRIFPEFTYFLFDEKPIREIFESYSVTVYKRFLKNSKKIFLDEIHLLNDPGRAVKILYDLIPEMRIVVTGSSSFNIKNEISESLAGRAFFYHLYPLTFEEYLFQVGAEKTIGNSILENILFSRKTPTVKPYDLNYFLEEVLVFGLYPELVNYPRSKEYLLNLSNTVVFKDILELKLIENRKKAEELLKLLAYQIGNLISYSEIAAKLGMAVKTVKKYIDIFEESFLVFRLYPFFRNTRREIGKSPKIYFWDLGLRNAVIGNFDPLRTRTDVGALFENLVIAEVKKLNEYLGENYSLNYWRLKTGSEVDLVLSKGEEIIGCEIKFVSGRENIAFKRRYPKAKFHVVNKGNLIS